jgi:hypothetical protein
VSEPPTTESTAESEPAWEDVPESGPVAVDLDCDTCGGPLTWDPEADALACGHCGGTRPVPRAEGTIVERALDDAGAAARGLGLAVRATRCANCGARVTFDESATATHCVFCGAAGLLDQEANRNALRPESLIPLDVGRAKVEAAFGRWVKGLWFRPNALKRQREFRAVGVYLPAWTFDADVTSEWSADSGTYYWVTVPVTTMVNGKPRVTMQRQRRIRWRPAWGDRRDRYDDLPVIASRGVDADLARRLGPYTMAELVPYRPEYLAGWRAEEYQIDLEQGWELGRERIEERQRARCAGDVPGDTHRNLRVRNTIRDVRWKHVLLPLWSLTYTFRGKPYAVLVHGQTGNVVGRAPWSWAKLSLSFLALVAAFLAIAFATGALRI